MSNQVTIIQLSKAELSAMMAQAAKQAAIDAVVELEKRRPEKKFSKNQARKMLKIGTKRLETLIESKILLLDSNGKITEKSINKYLNNN